MPSTFVKAAAKRAGVSVTKVEKFWKQAKGIVKKDKPETDPDFFGLVTTIFKNNVKKHLGLALESCLPCEVDHIMNCYLREQKEKMEKQDNFKRLLEDSNSDLEKISKWIKSNGLKARGTSLTPTKDGDLTFFVIHGNLKTNDIKWLLKNGLKSITASEEKRDAFDIGFLV